MATTETFVIVGGGLAAAEAAKTLRADGFDGRLVIVTEEDRQPYERPPLTKQFLRGEVGEDTLLAQAPDFYEEQRVEVATANPAVRLDPAQHRVQLRDGAELRYDGLLIATGARAVRPSIDGADRPSVHVVRTAEDSARLRAHAREAGTAIVAGGGWIAAETAASLTQLGVRVTLVIPGEEVLERHLGSRVGRMFSDLHERHGVRLVRRARVEGVVGGGVQLTDGQRVGGDLVVLGFGAEPATELGSSAGLAIADGILVDERLATAADGVFAAGDVASAWHPRYGRRVRSEHWDNARRQARTAAHNLLGAGETYDRVPYFFSDQFELGMELIGLPQEADELAVRREADGIVALWARDGRVVAGMHADLRDTKKTIDQLVTAAVPFDRKRFATAGLAALASETAAA
jgi:3-phenylpropionate/trans-cinnamate dioxygenase ferredoxin reductase subunit